MKRLFPLFFSVLATLFVLSISISAATFTVTKAANSNDGVCNADCSLREAVAAANDGDTVAFNPGLVGQTFTLGGSPIDVFDDITIDGDIDTVNVAQISGANTSRHFNIRTGASVLIRNITLVSGNGVNGGAIATETGGDLRLDRVSIRSNTSNFGGALYLFGVGTHVITNSSISGNTSEFAPAMLVSNSSSLYMSNTTVTNNRNIINNAAAYGAITTFSSGTFALRNCTITLNTANNGGGLYVAGAGSITLGNTIVAGNTSGFGAADIESNGSPITSLGGNLIQNTATVAGIFNQTKDITGQNPRVAPTNSNQGGHPIFTHPLQAGSPAIGGGINALAVEPFSNTALTTDARGGTFARTVGTSVDKGAFEDESNSANLYVSKLADTNDTICDHDCSLREAVAAAATDSGTDNIFMAANVFGTMTLAGFEIPVLNNNINIFGYPSLNADTLVLSAGGNSRIFELENSNVTMTGFTIADGNGQGSSQPFGGGAMRVFGGSLTLDRMIIRDNTVGNGEFGGAISAQSVNVMRIMNSTFTDNRANSVPAMALDVGVTYMTNTTISGNSDPVGGDCGGAVSVTGSLYMRNSTVAFNRCSTSTDGAGILFSGTGIINLGNTVISDNLAANHPDLNVAPGATLQSVGGNLIQSTTGYNNAIFVAPDDQIGVGAMLLALADNGGNVPTHGLSGGSPAMNTGWNSAATDPFSSQPLATDARGAGFTRIVGSRVDKGAFESLVPTAASTSIGGRVLSGPGGKPVANVVVVLTGPNGVVGSQVTGHLGYYQFNDVEVGHNYIVSVQSKRFTFEPRLVNLVQEVLDLDLVATQ